MTALSELEDVPSWLEIPPVSAAAITPPITTLDAELPLERLQWEDFERLCLRLARTQSDVVGARLYGTRGQDQEGIDLFAHRHGKPYRVFQCKRVQDLEPADIKKAVDLFLAGSWATRASELVLCTSDSLRTKQRQEAFEQQRCRLAISDQDLVPWTREEISELLRTQPEIVHAFFGQAWVERFCGPEAAALTANNISPADVQLLRRKLLELYQTVFAIQDAGFDGRSTTQSSLYDRYVVHDVIETVESSPIQAPVHADDEDDEASDEGDAPPHGSIYAHRLGLEDEIFGAPKGPRILLGGPGVGKSALLRYVILDLLNEHPRLTAVAKTWGHRLPIWLPFGAWVDQIQHNDRNASVLQAVRGWLSQWDADELAPVVEIALKDKRLLLLIDGLDEWTSEEAARIALMRLRVFAQRTDAPILLTSRPLGYRTLASDLPGWRSVEIAPLSESQQIDVATKWLAERVSGQPATATVEREARQAITELQQIPDATQLAEVPLLLCILLLLRSEHAALPSNRFAAYGELTRHLMFVQPRRRALSAGSVQPAHLDDREMEVAYAYLAYRIHTDHASGVLSSETIRTYFAEVLHEEAFGIGFSSANAARIARSLVEVGESVSGVLVKRSQTELGFYHRCIQEHLVTEYLLQADEAIRLSTVSARVTNQSWREIVLGLAIRSGSQEAAVRVIDAIEVGNNNSPRSRMARAEILTEIATGPGPCPIQKRTALIQAACSEIEEGWCLQHRTALLQPILSSLGRSSVSRVATKRLRRWFPERVWFRVPLIRALQTWPNDEAWPLLRLALLNDDAHSNQLAAADVIAQKWRGDSVVRDELRRLALRPYSPATRSVILTLLMEGWNELVQVQQILDARGSSSSPELLIAGIWKRIRAADSSDGDRDELLRLLGNRGASYEWRPIAFHLLLTHWPGDLVVRDAALRAVRTRGGLDPDVPLLDEAWDLLLNGFPMDDQVAGALIEELDDRFPRFRRIDWSILGRQFRGHVALSEALERWAERTDTFRSEMVGALTIGRSEQAKQLLLAELSDESNAAWAARGLLEGWGMSDPEVATALTSAAGQTERATEIAHLLPQIIAERTTCVSRLLNLLEIVPLERTNPIVGGLEQLNALGDPEFARIALAQLAVEKVPREAALLSGLIRFHAANPRVRELAMRELDNADGQLAAVACGFADDASIRARIAEMISPLSSDLRAVVAEHFLRLGARGDALELSRDFTWERNAEIATKTAIARYRGLQVNNSVANSDVALLRNELASYGLRYPSRRQAAYAAALTIEQGALIDEANETIGDPVPLRVMLTDGGDRNRVLIRQIIAEYPRLAARYPGAVLSRFQDRGHAETDAALGQESWVVVADDLDGKSTLDPQLAQFVSDTRETLDPALLRYLGRRFPRSQQLRAHCLRALSEDVRAWNFYDRLETASELLAQHFESDQPLWDALEAIVDVKLEPGPFVALARSRPDSAVVRRHADNMWRSPRGKPALLVFYAMCISATADELLEQIAIYWAASPLGAWLHRPLLHRLRRDRVTRSRFEHALAEPSTNVNVELCVPLAAVSALSPDVLTRLEEQLARESSGIEAAGFTYDARFGRLRPTASVIVDLLEAATPTHSTDDQR